MPSLLRGSPRCYIASGASRVLYVCGALGSKKNASPCSLRVRGTRQRRHRGCHKRRASTRTSACVCAHAASALPAQGHRADALVEAVRNAVVPKKESSISDRRRYRLTLLTIGVGSPEVLFLVHFYSVLACALCPHAATRKCLLLSLSFKRLNRARLRGHVRCC